MKDVKERWRWAVLAVLVVAAFAGGAIKERIDQAAVARASLGSHDELPARSFLRVTDETGAAIAYTGHYLAAGDEFITEDDRWYRVSEVSGNRARCRLVGALPPVQQGTAGMMEAETKPSQPSAPQPAPGQPSGGTAGAIGIYHTHSDESYEPTEGTESVQSGKGGVIRVGSALMEALKSRALTAIQDTTSHAPHDAMAYSRSRRTAMNLMRQARLALFDVHRDAAPPGEYNKQVSGEKVTQIMMVVGRQNPKYQSNLAFARRLKAAADKAHPGLIKGILIAGGNFNQDLSDRALLLEVGAESNSRADAEKAVRLLADDIPKVVGASTEPGGGLTGTTGAQGRSAARALGGILIVLAVGVAGYLLISTGSLREAASKIGKFGGRELANFLGGRSRRRRSGGRGDSPDENDPDENRGGCGS
ncbi:MAG: stage II sporulation protein P [Ignavibacteriales bacterium]